MHTLQGAHGMSAKSPQTVRRPVQRSVVIALESVDCGTINQSRRVRRGPEIASQRLGWALEGPIGSIWSSHRRNGVAMLTLTVR
jgi:hypothetical protein